MHGWGVRSGAENSYASTGVVDGGEDVLALPGQGDGLDEVDRQDPLGLRAQEASPRHGRALGDGSTPAALRMSQTVDAATEMPRRASSPWIRR